MKTRSSLCFLLLKLLCKDIDKWSICHTGDKCTFAESSCHFPKVGKSRRKKCTFFSSFPFVKRSSYGNWEDTTRLSGCSRCAIFCSRSFCASESVSFLGLTLWFNQNKFINGVVLGMLLESFSQCLSLHPAQDLVKYPIM